MQYKSLTLTLYKNWDYVYFIWALQILLNTRIVCSGYQPGEACVWPTSDIQSWEIHSAFPKLPKGSYSGIKNKQTKNKFSFFQESIPRIPQYQKGSWFLKGFLWSKSIQRTQSSCDKDGRSDLINADEHHRGQLCFDIQNAWRNHWNPPDQQSSCRDTFISFRLELSFRQTECDEIPLSHTGGNTRIYSL